MGCGNSVAHLEAELSAERVALSSERTALAEARKQLKEHGLSLPDDDRREAQAMKLRMEDRYDISLPLEVFVLASAEQLRHRVTRLEEALAKARNQLETQGKSLCLRVQMDNGTQVERTVLANEPVVILKMRAHEDDVTIAPPSVSVLKLGGSELANTDTFADHGIEENAVLHLTFHPGITVTFKPLSGEEKKAVIWPGERIGVMLKRVMPNETVRTWGINGEALDGMLTVDAAGIRDGAVLEPHDVLVGFDGDLDHFKGVLHHIGTSGGTRGYLNPFTDKAVAIEWSGDCANYYSSSTGHRQGDIDASGKIICSEAHPGDNATQWSRGAPNASFTVDIGAYHGYSLLPTHYCYRGDAGGGGNHPRTWELQASRDRNSWTTLRTHRSDNTVNSGTVGSFPIETKDGDYYRFFRIQNKGSPNHLCCSGIEFYGHLREEGHAAEAHVVLES